MIKGNRQWPNHIHHPVPECVRLFITAQYISQFDSRFLFGQQNTRFHRPDLLRQLHGQACKYVPMHNSLNFLPGQRIQSSCDTSSEPGDFVRGALHDDSLLSSASDV